MRSLLGLSVVLLLCCASTAHAAGPTGLLNDTGQTQCYDVGMVATCTVANAGDAATDPGQDGRFGRDRAAPAKVGGGAAGFDFTKVCMDGSLNCAGAANTGASPALTDWACTKDNVTNLIWSLESGFGDWTTYASTTLPAATNGGAGRCGTGNPWRLPTRRELLSIVHHGLSAGPMVDTGYFPSTDSGAYWASEAYAPSPGVAWLVSFDNGGTNGTSAANGLRVRLVRSGP